MDERTAEQVVADGIYADTWIEPDPDRPETHHRFARWQANCAARLAIAALSAAGFAVVKVDDAAKQDALDAFIADVPWYGGDMRDRYGSALTEALTALGLSEPVETGGQP